MSKRLERVSTIILLWSSLLISVNAQSFTFEHATCDIKIKHQEGEYAPLGELLKELLTNKGFKVKYLVENKKVYSNDLYMNLEVHRPKAMLYKDCMIKIALKMAKGNYISKQDKVLYIKEGKRTLPRVTFAGMERCKLALKDNFIHIPHCIEIGRVGEKK